MGSENTLEIRRLGEGDVLKYAGEELARYLERMLDGTARVSLSAVDGFDPDTQDVLWIGLSEKLGLDMSVPDGSTDDAVYIDVQHGKGLIAGVNQRSVLLGVYRFLTEAGCRWLRPGADGELIPRLERSALTVSVNEKASYRHRGLCIEGSLQYEHLVQMLEWLPKVGFNSYFIQFREAYTFFERWYTHRHDPLKAGGEFSISEARELVNRAEGEIRKRGLLYHAVGHGWTCEPFGIPGLSWDQQVSDVPPGAEQYLALVNGKRAVWQGIPLNTNLCYSNPEVRRKIIDDITGYIRKHPVIDYLHFWLADDRNNHCECGECRKAVPSDFYVQMLNELDERLSAEGLATRVVFLIYVDLLWPPETQRLVNPDRFVLMFAPITRLYNQSFSGVDTSRRMRPFRRNRLEFPVSVDENLAYLRGWQDAFAGDSFDFDYHMMWAHYFDTGYEAIARTVSEDVKNLHRIGLDGLISCQVQRAFMPTGLPMAVMAKTLWDQEASFDEIADDYFLSAFGPDGVKCRQLLSRMPEFLGTMDIWATDLDMTPVAKQFQAASSVISEVKALSKKNRTTGTPAWNASWKYLGIFMEIVSRMSDVFSARVAGEREATRNIWEELKTFISRQEEEILLVFDLYEFVQTYEFMNWRILNITDAERSITT